MGYGRVVRKGSLPVFSVGTEEEARELLVMSCPVNVRGEFVAPELAQEQTLENLYKFSDRLARFHRLVVERGRCTCKGRQR